LIGTFHIPESSLADADGAVLSTFAFSGCFEHAMSRAAIRTIRMAGSLAYLRVQRGDF
jgi:hypothetical protein